MIKCSDYIFEYFASKGIDTVFAVSGGAASHLLDSLSKNKNFKVYFMRHEQACAMAADGYARIANKPAIVLVTNGPGSTNTITGVLGAYQDSIPMIVISGQVPTNQTLGTITQWDNKLRQLGVQECNIIDIITPITLFRKQIKSKNEVKNTLEESHKYISVGRKGPIWLDIPLDVQNSQITNNELDQLLQSRVNYTYSQGSALYPTLRTILESGKFIRPLIVAGNGIHLSQTEEEFIEFAKPLNFPVVTTWNSKDLFDYNDPQFIGSFGILGERAANLAVQKCDLMLILGCRLSIPNTGYDQEKFAPNAFKIMVDIDKGELEKPGLNINLKIQTDLKSFFYNNKNFTINNYGDLHWNLTTKSWKDKYPVYQPEYANEKNGINSFYFIEELSKHLKDNHVVVTDMGTAFTCTMQAMKMNGRARLFTSSGTSSMGYGLPGAIGAYIADPTKEVILIAGDGGFQMNIQELQTLRQYNIPLKIFILNNNGYSAISLMQDNLFGGNYVGSTAKDVSAPDFVEIVKAYGLKFPNVFHINKVPLYKKELLDWDLIFNSKEPCLVEVKIPENQPLYPRVQSSKDINGNIISSTLDNMYPYLSDEEMKEINEKL